MHIDADSNYNWLYKHLRVHYGGDGRTFTIHRNAVQRSRRHARQQQALHYTTLHYRYVHVTILKPMPPPLLTLHWLRQLGNISIEMIAIRCDVMCLFVSI